MATITISREFGAGGRTLGKMISKALGYAYVDAEIIQMVAERARVSANWVESVEKEAGGRLLKYTAKLIPKRIIDLVLDDSRGYIDEEIYVDLLAEIINRIADEGNAVIIGRGSQYILRGRKDAFHILLVATKEDRLKFLETHYGLTPKEAALIIGREENRRKGLYRKFGKEDYDHSDLYHLVINTSKQDLDKACQIICQLVTT